MTDDSGPVQRDSGIVSFRPDELSMWVLDDIADAIDVFGDHALATRVRIERARIEGLEKDYYEPRFTRFELTNVALALLYMIAIRDVRPTRKGIDEIVEFGTVLADRVSRDGVQLFDPYIDGLDLDGVSIEGSLCQSHLIEALQNERSIYYDEDRVAAIDQRDSLDPDWHDQYLVNVVEMEGDLDE